MRIMVVDDDPETAAFVSRGLAYEGYTVDTALGGSEALLKASDREPDLVVLDVMMPELDGLEVARRLRRVGDIPILMLTARSSVADKVVALDSGADDYLIKPFAFDELLARVRALLRRADAPAPEILRIGGLSLNTATREATRENRTIELSARECELLELFMRNPRRVLQRDEIMERIWGPSYGGGSNVMEVYIRYLRSKLGAEGYPELIHTVRGVGYMLKEWPVPPSSSDEI